MPQTEQDSQQSSPAGDGLAAAEAASAPAPGIGPGLFGAQTSAPPTLFATPVEQHAPVAPPAPVESPAQAAPVVLPTPAVLPALPAQPATPYSPDAPWPANVPPQRLALEILRGHQPAPELLLNARRVQDALTQPERVVLIQPGLSDVLRYAVGVRWRLAAALDLLPAAQGKVEKAALDALLGDADRALEELRHAVSTTPELALAVDLAWETLTTEAVAFSNKVKSAEAHLLTPVQATAPKLGATGSRPALKGATGSRPALPPPAEPQKDKQKEPTRSKGMYIAFAVVLLGAAAYHVTNLLPSRHQVPTVPGAPSDTMVTSDPATGMMMVSTTRSGDLNDEQKAWIKQQEAKGFRAKPISPSSVMLTRIPPPPATPSPAPRTAGADKP